MKRNDRNRKPVRRMLAEVGVVALAFSTLIGISAESCAQTASENSGPKEFFERLRPPFMKSKKENTNAAASGNNAVPSGFTEVESDFAPPAVSATGSAGNPSGTVSGNDGFAPIGTSYATPTSTMPPSAASRRLNPSPAFNPSSANSRPGTAYNAAVPPSSGTVLPGSASGTPAGNVVFGAPAASAPGSASGNSGLPDPFPVNQRVFHLPYGNFLPLVPNDQLREVRLYVSRDNGVTWKAYQTLTREQIQAQQSKDIPIRTGSDGEFWFSLRVVNQQGAEIPGESPTPTWRILVNTTGQPMNSLMNANRNANGNGNSTGTPGGTQNAGISGQNVGGISGQNSSEIPSSSPFSTADGTPARPQWAPTPDGTQSTGNSGNTGGTGVQQNPNIVIYSVKDRNSTAIPDVSLPVYRIQNSKPIAAFQDSEPLSGSGTGSASASRAHSAAKPETKEGSGSELSGSSDSADASGSSDNSSTSDFGDFGDLGSIGESINLDDTSGTSGTSSETLPENASDASSELPPDLLTDSSTDSSSDSNDDMLLMLGETSSNEEGINSKIRYMNEPRLSVDYDVSTVGSSGVGRVELWGTLDAGQTWTYMAEDKDCTSPIQTDLKSDGRYGLAILIFNGAGVGMERPQAGAAPQMEVVLDRINPRVQLYGIQLQAEFGDLEITWGAEDLNFGSNPVLLSWSSSTEGPWRAMSPMPLENTGRYTWRIPEGVPGKVYIRIDVCDLAKNSTTLVTGPVVTDVVRPTGVILDAKPHGN